METTVEEYYSDDYANFGMRLVAYLIDSVLMSIVSSIILTLCLGPTIGTMMTTESMNPENLSEEETMAFLGTMMAAVGSMVIFSLIMQWLYFAIMESSANQGTLGKMALGIKVTDMNGDRISFLRATGRFFAKIISGMVLMIGYIMAAFTERNQALHDMMASTLVLKKDVPPLD